VSDVAWTLMDGILSLRGEDVLRGVDSVLGIHATTTTGVFLEASFERSKPRHVLRLGTAPAAQAWTGCHRCDPYWMRPHTAPSPEEIPTDTQYELAGLHGGRYLLLVPLVDAVYHGCLRGSGSGLELVLDTGHPQLSAARSKALYVAIADDPHELLPLAAADVCTHLAAGRLRVDKPVPAFVDGIGWCTWDAFYRDVTGQGVLDGLQSLRDAGVTARFVILDDGWQTVSESTHEGRLTALRAHPEFGDLAETVRRAKSEYGVEAFLAWHAVHGYWSGIDPVALPRYGSRAVLRWYAPEVLGHAPEMNAIFCGAEGFPPQRDSLRRFFDDYHQALASAGVDGVKVDNQSSVEGFGHASGGRVAAWADLRRALEQSARQHFDGRLINCMASASEGYYFARDSTLTRTSTDFWPNDPASHGQHLYTNALVSFWFGEFNHPDWDMFQSAHPAGPYHAAARAISGGPIYVSDEPTWHDGALLRQLVHFDGTIPRCLDVARPTRRSLFVDPTRERHALQVYNRNLASCVVGLFDARRDGSDDAIECEIGPGDVPRSCWRSLEGIGINPNACSRGMFAIYLQRAATLHRTTWEQVLKLQLGPLGHELATIAPVVSGLAPIGLLDKLNAGGTLTSFARYPDGRVELELRDGGRFGCYAMRAPTRLLCDDTAASRSSYDSASGLLTLALPPGKTYRIVIVP